MLVEETYDQTVAARLEEYWATSSPWQRRLWNSGSVAAISELLESSDNLLPQALKALQADVDRLVGADPAVGDAATRRSLRNLVTGDLTFRRVGWHSLNELLSVIDEGYVKRWSDSLREAKFPRPERVARSIAGHLLHAGFSPTYLHRWLRYQVQHRTDNLTIADLLEEAERDLIGRPIETFKIIVPVFAAPAITPNIPPPEWRSATEIAILIAGIQGIRPSLRQNGGFVLSLHARDPYAAVDKARELLDRWSARAELATRKGIIPVHEVWVEGIRQPIPFVPPWRRVDIGALDRENQIYAPLADDELSIRIDDAIQLVQPMESGPRAAAISGGWAAIEALLTDGEAHNMAARRLAGIIACSYPRAELTTLSYLHAQYANDALASDLQAEIDNLRRSRLVADAISRSATLSGRGSKDDAAYRRMQEVLTQPKETLHKVRDYVESALNRLYRQRNLTLHGGRVSGDGRTETLATVPPLVGAGLDRIAHAWFTERTHPIVLAARADLSLELVGSAAGRHPTELLEPR